MTYMDAVHSYGNAVVPYVADFTGTRFDGRTQRPVPRPFYCTKYPSSSVFGEKGVHDWNFVNMPNSASVEVDKLYHPFQSYPFD